MAAHPAGIPLLHKGLFISEYPISEVLPKRCLARPIPVNPKWEKHADGNVEIRSSNLIFFSFNIDGYLALLSGTLDPSIRPVSSFYAKLYYNDKEDLTGTSRFWGLFLASQFSIRIFSADGAREVGQIEGISSFRENETQYIRDNFGSLGNVVRTQPQRNDSPTRSFHISRCFGTSSGSVIRLAACSRGIAVEATLSISPSPSLPRRRDARLVFSLDHRNRKRTPGHLGSDTIGVCGSGHWTRT